MKILAVAPASARQVELVLQKPGSFNCGQCCVAMLAGITRKQANKAFGTKGGTTTKMVVRALKKLGLAPADKLQTFRREASLPARCILVLRYPKTVQHYGHWVVYCQGLIYCPSLGIYPFAEIAAQGRGAKCTSYLAVTIP